MRIGLVEPTWNWLMILLNFGVIVLIMKHFLFEPVSNFMEARENEIKDQIQSAKTVEEEAKAFKKEYEAKLARADEEGKELIREHVQKGENRAFEIIKSAEGEIESMKLHAHRELETERVKAINELKDQISELAVMSASKVIQKTLDEAAHKEMIDQFIEEVGDTKWQN